MKHNSVISIYTSAILSAFLFLSVLIPNKVCADESDSSLGEKIAATYLLTEDDEGGSRIVTITADGHWSGIHSYQFDNNFSNQYGSWEKAGEGKITVSTLNFVLLKDGIGTSRFNFTVEFDNTYQKMSGELSGNMFPPGVDPLDPVAVPIRTFSNTFTGKRLIITEK